MWTVEFGADTYGENESWGLDFDKGGVGGLRAIQSRRFDLTRNLGHGAVKGPHYREAPVVTLALVTVEDLDASAALDLVDDLVTAWDVLPDGDTTTLIVNLPGRSYTMVGAPTAIDVDLGIIHTGVAFALCEFTVYDSVVTVGAGS